MFLGPLLVGPGWTVWLWATGLWAPWCGRTLSIYAVGADWKLTRKYSFFSEFEVAFSYLLKAFSCMQGGTCVLKCSLISLLIIRACSTYGNSRVR